ncbi:MAG: hypothetical protein OEV15_02745 [Gallionella sp.]|nr:hypothetical protein [Gallionella sp.]
MNYLSKLMCFTLLSALLNAPAVIAAPAPQPAKGTPAATTAPGSQTQPAAVIPQAISFNRLMRAPTRRHMPPLEDGLRDPANAETALLQPPLDVYASLPRFPSDLGNGVAWVKAVNEGKIKPRWDRLDPAAEPMIMDMSVVRVPKGTMPDVVFPHKEHTQWLDCSNCHPDIFIPQKGANQISMAAIILGQKCGVCHGKVAFPVSECRLCHSQARQDTAAAATPAKAKGGAKP